MDNIECLQELDELLKNPGNPMDEPDGWNEWRRFVLAELKRLNTWAKTLQKEVHTLHINQTKLLVKVGLIVGAVSLVMSAIGTAIVVAVLKLILV